MVDVEKEALQPARLHFKGISIDEKKSIKLEKEPLSQESFEPDYVSLQNKDKNLRLWVEITVTCILSFTSLGVGYIFGFTGVALSSMMTNSTQIPGEIILDNEQAALFSSSAMFASIFGSFFTAPLLIHFGQKTTLISTSIITLVAILVGSFANTFWLLLLCRLVLGLYPVVQGSSLTSYIAEISHPVHRATLLSILDLVRQVGFLYVFVVGSTELSWRNVNLICGVTSVGIPLLILPFLPNSPRWLLLKGDKRKAEAALTFYRGNHYDTEQEIEKIIEDVGNRSNKSTSFLIQLKLLGNPPILKRFLILFYINLALHFTGNFIIITYAVTIFQLTGTNINEYMSTILVGVIRVIGSLLYTLIADKINRRTLLLPSLLLAAVCTIVLGVYFHLDAQDVDMSSLRNLPLITCLLFNLCLCIGFPIILMSRAELLPTSVRSLGISLLYSPLFLGAFTVTLTYPFMVDTIGPAWTFWIYSINTILLTIICFWAIPETKGKTLEEINKNVHK